VVLPRSSVRQNPPPGRYADEHARDARADRLERRGHIARAQTFPSRIVPRMHVQLIRAGVDNRLGVERKFVRCTWNRGVEALVAPVQTRLQHRKISTN
jgi:hypothetical protein